MCEYDEGYDCTPDVSDSETDIDCEWGGSLQNDEAFESLTDGLDIDDLRYLRDEVQSGNDEIISFFGYGSDIDDSSDGYQKVLRR